MSAEQTESSLVLGASYSRYTFSPMVKGIGFSKIGPSKQKVWNSPFSPQESTPSGRFSIKFSSITVPTKSSSKYLELAQTTIVLKPKFKNSVSKAFGIFFPNRKNSFNIMLGQIVFAVGA